MVEAAHGQAALAQIATTDFDLVLLDLQMPEMDGVELIAALRESEVNRDLPIIVITAQDVRPEERARLEQSVRRILQKGNFGMADLLREIHTAAQRNG